jgi:hypothetical protein
MAFQFNSAQRCRWPRCSTPHADHFRKPYHNFVHSLCETWPPLHHLANFMDEPFHKVVPWGQPNLQIAVVDFSGDGSALQGQFGNADALSAFLTKCPQEGVSRLFLVEGLSRDLVEFLGTELDVDPAFFTSHLWGLDWFPRRSSSSTVPCSLSSARQQSFIRFQYLEARQIKEVPGRPPGIARHPSWDTNILRKISIHKLASTQYPIGFARRHTTIGMKAFDTKYWTGAPFHSRFFIRI